MAKKIQEKPKVSQACYDLSSVGKMYICNFGDDDKPGKTTISLSVYQKKKKASKLQDDAISAVCILAKLGFKDLFKDASEGVNGIMAMADIEIEYEINKRPYTIVNADLQEMKSLNEVMNCSGTRVLIIREEPDYEEVHTTEFKKAVANYITQNQK